MFCNTNDNISFERIYKSFCDIIELTEKNYPFNINTTVYIKDKNIYTKLSLSNYYETFNNELLNYDEGSIGLNLKIFNLNNNKICYYKKTANHIFIFVNKHYDYKDKLFEVLKDIFNDFRIYNN